MGWYIIAKHTVIHDDSISVAKSKVADLAQSGERQTEVQTSVRVIWRACVRSTEFAFFPDLLPWTFKLFFRYMDRLRLCVPFFHRAKKVQIV